VKWQEPVKELMAFFLFRFHFKCAKLNSTIYREYKYQQNAFPIQLPWLEDKNA
jgi:hypothetical protein